MHSFPILGEREEKEMVEISEIFRTRDNLLGLNKVTLAELEEKGELVHIPNCDRIALRGKRAHDVEACNKYYVIKELENAIFMCVQDNYGVIIPRYVYHDNQKINVVKRLSQYYWAIDTKNNISASMLKYKGVYRVIWALQLYGDEKQALPQYWDIHHKWYRWWNIIEATATVCKEKHKMFHKEDGKSHQTGEYFDDVAAFKKEMKRLKKARKIVATMSM